MGDPMSSAIYNYVAGNQYNIFNDQDPKTDFLRWLKKLALGLDHERKHITTCEQYLEGSCQWFVEDKRFMNWVDGRTTTLICLGSPGAGKTVVVSFVIKHLLSKFEHTRDVCVAYIYCDYKQRTEQTHLSLLASLLAQLVQRLEHLCPQTEAFFRYYQGQHVPSSILLRVVLDVVKQFRRLFIIVDALDEWSVLDKDAQQLYQMLGSLGKDVSLLFTARHDYSNIWHFDGTSFLPIRARDTDIKHYARKSLETLAGLLDKEHTDLIMQRVVSLSGGIFLLAKLSLELARQWGIEQFAEGSVPQSIPWFYDHIMERIMAERNTLLARKILFWVVHSMRPLYLQELRYAISPSQNHDRSTLESFRTMTVNVCAGLVVIDQVNACHIIHSTAQQYLEEYLNRSTTAHVDIVRDCLRHISFCTRSLLEDEGHDREAPADTYFRVQGALDSFAHPFLRYAAHTWGFHARYNESQVLEDVAPFLDNKNQVRLASLLLLPPERAATFNHSPMHLVAYFDLPIIARQLISKGWDVDSVDSSLRTPLSLAAERGSVAVLEPFLAKTADPNKADMNGDTPLAWATKCNQYAIIQRLRDVHTVQLDSRNASGYTPLCIAASNGHVEIVDLLLRVDTNTATLTEESRGFPLSCTALDGNKRRLLEMRTTEGQTALLLAAWNGHVDVVISLLRAGANVNARDNMGFTAISQAAERGEEQIVKILLNSNADGNAMDEDGNTPLTKVSMLRPKYITRGTRAIHGRMQVLKMLLRHPGIRVDFKNWSGNTPLIEAAGYRKVPMRSNALHPKLDFVGEDVHEYETYFNQVVEALLDRGANVNMRNVHGHTPVQQAASQGHLEIVKTLCKRGAHVDVVDGVGITPLLSAVRGRHAGVVEELLRFDSRNIDHEDRHGFTALGHAARIGHNELVRLLLHAGAKVDSKRNPLWLAAGGEGKLKRKLPSLVARSEGKLNLKRNPLLLAAGGDGKLKRNSPLLITGSNHEEVVISLLDHGADFCHQSSRLSTPLHFAVICGHVPVVASLLLRNSNLPAVNARNSKDRTPLIYAALQGRDAIIPMLLDHGADVNSRDCEGRSALSYAAGGGHDNITKILLKQPDIDVDRHDNDSKTPAWHAVRWGHTKVLRVLIDYYLDLQPLLDLALEFGRVSVAEYLFAVMLRREEESKVLNVEVPNYLDMAIPPALPSYPQFAPASPVWPQIDDFLSTLPTIDSLGATAEQSSPQFAPASPVWPQFDDFLSTLPTIDSLGATAEQSYPQFTPASPVWPQIDDFLSTLPTIDSLGATVEQFPFSSIGIGGFSPNMDFLELPRDFPLDITSLQIRSSSVPPPASQPEVAVVAIPVPSPKTLNTESLPEPQPTPSGISVTAESDTPSRAAHERRTATTLSPIPTLITTSADEVSTLQPPSPITPSMTFKSLGQPNMVKTPSPSPSPKIARPSYAQVASRFSTTSVTARSSSAPAMQSRIRSPGTGSPFARSSGLQPAPSSGNSSTAAKSSTISRTARRSETPTVPLLIASVEIATPEPFPQLQPALSSSSSAAWPAARQLETTRTPSPHVSPRVGRLSYAQVLSHSRRKPIPNPDR